MISRDNEFRNNEMLRMRMSAACMAVAMMLAACGGGGDSADTSSKADGVKGTVAGLSVDGLVLTNGTDSVTLAANATSFTLPAGGTLAVAQQPLGFTKACDVGGTAAAPAVSCGDAVAKVTSVAGQGTIDNNAPGAPIVVVSAPNGDLYMANSYAVYKASPIGGYELVAGSLNNPGYTDDTTGSNARFNNISDIALDSQGNLFVVDQNGSTIRKITPQGAVSSVYFAPQAQSLSKLAVGANGVVYLVEGGNTVTSTVLDGNPAQPVANANGFVTALTVKPDGTLYYATNNGLYKLVNQQPVLFAVSSSAILPTGTVMPSITLSNYNFPNGLAVDAQGVVYFADQSGQVVRRIDASGNVSTIAGDDASLSGNSTDGTGASAAFAYLRKLSLNSNGTVLYGTEGSSPNVRAIKNLTAAAAQASTAVRAYAGPSAIMADSTPAGFGVLSSPVGVAVNANGTTYISDSNHKLIRKITADGTMTTLAGNGSQAYVNGTGTSASFYDPKGLAVDTLGNVYVADNCQIRKVTPDGVVTTVAGTANSCGLGQGPATSTPVSGVTGLTVDAAGVVYFVTSSSSVFKVANGQVTAVAGYPTNVSLPANVYGAQGIALDASGNLYVPAYNSHQIVKITQSGGSVAASVIAGQSFQSGSVDGDAASTALFNYPVSLTLDALGNVYVVQEGQGQQGGAVRKISPSGVVSTLAGGSNTVGFSNGIGADAVFQTPSGIAINAAGELLVTDRYNSRLRKVSPVKAP